MFLNAFIETEVEDQDDIDAVSAVVEKDPDTPEGMDNIANDVESLMQQSALESVTFFDGGEEAVKKFTESAEVKALVEARRMSKRTFVRIGKDDDLTRRKHLASLMIAKEKNDPLFKQLALNRVKERKLRNAIFQRYGQKAELIAKKSQKKHIADMRKMPALPKVNF